MNSLEGNRIINVLDDAIVNLRCAGGRRMRSSARPRSSAEYMVSQRHAAPRRARLDPSRHAE